MVITKFVYLKLTAIRPQAIKSLGLVAYRLISAAIRGGLVVKFILIVTNSLGQRQKATVEATDKNAAIQKIQAKGLILADGSEVEVGNPEDAHSKAPEESSRNQLFPWQKFIRTRKQYALYATLVIGLLLFALLLLINKDSVVCDKFDLDAKLVGATLTLSVETDLPDDTTVWVSVSRTYFEKGNSEAYSLEYFDEKSTIGDWRIGHEISIDNDKWEKDIIAYQKEMSKFGQGFDVALISGSVTASMVVPIKQPNPRFGEKNKNLTGKAVSSSCKILVVKGKQDIVSQMDSTQILASSFPNSDPLQLEIGATYFISRQTPLMRSLDSTNLERSLKQMIFIPVGGSFKVLGITNKAVGVWYKVEAQKRGDDQIYGGSINSSALFGQNLLGD